MSWPVGISWTKGYTATTQNPDGSEQTMEVHTGPFVWLPKVKLFGKTWEIYLGFRPTPTWGAGFGNEGIFAGIAQFLKKKGFGNIGLAFRIKKE
jgi:hypothetical protein